MPNNWFRLPLFKEKGRMGIKGLKPFLAKKGYLPVKMMLRDFAGCAVAIDAYGYAYTMLAVILSDEVRRINILVEKPDAARMRDALYARAASFILCCLSCGVTPVFVFDGTPPAEKGRKRAAKAEKKAQVKQQLEELRTHVLTASREDAKKAQALAKSLVTVSPAEAATFMGFLRNLGVPCLQSKTEGETLCAMGVRDGRFAAVYSKDTDNLAYGCPFLLTGLDLSGEEPAVICFELERILQTLQVSFPLFVDLCIMAGCDYNTNVPGLALIRSFPLLRQWGGIDQLPPERDMSCLNHKRCRELFAYVPFEDLIAEAAPAPADPELKGLVGPPPEKKAGRSLAADPRRFGETGFEALRSAELAEGFYEDLARGLESVKTPMLLRSFTPR